jgi:hypothetical protein
MKGLFGIVLSDKQRWMGIGALVGSGVTALALNGKKIWNSITSALKPEEESTATGKKEKS